MRIRQLTHMLMSVSRGKFLRPFSSATFNRRGGGGTHSMSSDTIKTIDPGTISFKSSVVQNNVSSDDIDVRTRSLLTTTKVKPSIVIVDD